MFPNLKCFAVASDSRVLFIEKYIPIKVNILS